MLGLFLPLFFLPSLPHVSELLHLSSAGAFTACGLQSNSEIAAPAPRAFQTFAAGCLFLSCDFTLCERAVPEWAAGSGGALPELQ